VDDARAVLAAMSGDPAPPRRSRRAVVAALIGLAVLSHPAGAQTGDGPTAEADRLVALGTQLAAEGDAAGAEAAFSGAADAGRALGRASAAVEHNLGTLALARGDAGRARLHTERAARLDPFDARIATNAALARALARVPPETPGERAWRTVRGAVGPAGLVALALALVYGALGVALTGHRRAAAGLGVLALAAVLAAAGALAEAPRGVMLTAADLREAPAPDASPGRPVAAGAVVQVSERRGAWRAVRVDGRSGWVPAGVVEALAP
ncbi:MAG TPA: SH3 domain-containing protein, partial [Rubricoccaceae bacterium]